MLFEEGEKLSHIYLIKEGEIEYSYFGSLAGLSSIAKHICKNVKVTYAPNRYEEEILFRMKHDKSLNPTKSYRVFSSTSEHIVGMDEFYYGIPKFFNGRVTSKTLKFYAVPIQNVKKMFEKNFNLNVLLENSTRNKAMNLLERVIDLKNTSLDLVGSRLSQDEIAEATKEFARRNSRRNSIRKEGTESRRTSNLVLPQVYPANEHKRTKHYTASFTTTMSTVETKASADPLSTCQSFRPSIGSKDEGTKMKRPIEESKASSSRDLFNMTAKNNMKFNMVINSKAVENIQKFEKLEKLEKLDELKLSVKKTTTTVCSKEKTRPSAISKQVTFIEEESPEHPSIKKYKAKVKIHRPSNVYSNYLSKQQFKSEKFLKVVTKNVSFNQILDKLSSKASSSKCK